jgi:hypothetical protein
LLVGRLGRALVNAHIYKDFPGPDSTLIDRVRWGAEKGPLHFRPVWYAALYFNAVVQMVPQCRDQFTARPNRPNVVILGDDLVVAKGPKAFHRRSMERYIPTCRAAVVISCMALPELYIMGSTGAAFGWNSLIVETRSEHERAWVNLIWDLAPDINMTIGKVEGEQ